MESEYGYYYLHTNGELIWKKFEPESDSPFVKHVWRMDNTERQTAWKVVLEALALGADVYKLKFLIDKWGLTIDDAVEMVLRVTPKGMMVTGFEKYLKVYHSMSLESFFDYARNKEEAKNRYMKIDDDKQTISFN